MAGTAADHRPFPKGLEVAPRSTSADGTGEGSLLDIDQPSRVQGRKNPHTRTNTPTRNTHGRNFRSPRPHQNHQHDRGDSRNRGQKHGYRGQPRKNHKTEWNPEKHAPNGTHHLSNQGTIGTGEEDQEKIDLLTEIQALRAQITTMETGSCAPSSSNNRSRSHSRSTHGRHHHRSYSHPPRWICLLYTSPSPRDS